MVERKSTAAPILAASTIVLLLLSAYVGGYFWLGESEDYPSLPGGPVVRLRVYDSQAWARFYQPAAKAETWLTGRDTSTGYAEAY